MSTGEHLASPLGNANVARLNVALPANADHVDSVSFEDMLETFVAHDVLQWHAEHPYECIPDAQHTPPVSHSKTLRKHAVGVKRLRAQDALRHVKDSELHDKLSLMVHTRFSKRAKPCDDSPDSAAPPTAAAAVPQPPPNTSDEDNTPPAVDNGASGVISPDVPWDDRSDLMVDPKLFLEVQAKLAKPFTLDAFARDDGSNALYEIDDCTAFGPCSTCGITPSSLLVCGEQISRQRGETAREPKLPDHSRDPGNYKLTTASAPTTACFVTGQHYPMYPATPHEVRKQAKAG